MASMTIHASKQPTQYTLVREGSDVVLRARADKSASGLIAQPLSIDLSQSPIVEWSWRSDTHLPEADNSVAAREDAPVRLVFAFEGDKDSLPLKERLLAERVKLFTPDVTFPTQP